MQPSLPRCEEATARRAGPGAAGAGRAADKHVHLLTPRLPCPCGHSRRNTPLPARRSRCEGTSARPGAHRPLSL